MPINFASHIEEALNRRASKLGLTTESLIEQFLVSPSPIGEMPSRSSEPTFLFSDLTFLQTVINTGIEKLWVVEREADGKFRFTFAHSTNQKYASMLHGWVGKTLGGIFDDRNFVDRRYEHLNAFLADPSRNEFSMWVPLGDEMILFTTRLARLDAVNGRPRILGVSRRITDHIHVEETLARREREYHSILEYPRDVVCSFLPDTTVVYANETYCRYFNIPREEIIGKSFLPLTDPSQHEIILKHIDYMMENSAPKLHERMTRRGDGEMRLFQWMNYGVTDETGHVIHLHAVGRDITDLRKIQQRVQETEERYRTIVEAATDGILLVEADGKIAMANPFVEAMFGYEPGEMAGQTIESLVPLDVANDHPALRDTYVSNPVTRPMGGSDLNLKGRRKDDSVFPVDVSLSPVEIDGQVFTLCIVKDMTLRAELEAQHLQNEKLALQLEGKHELIKLRERFVSMMVHEFRTPLAVIQTVVDMISKYYDRFDKEEIITRLGRIPMQIDKMNQLIDKTLEISRSTPMIEIDPKPLPSELLCETVVGALRDTQWGKHEILVDIDNMPEIVNVDGVAIAHILSNLLINAIKYSPDGKPVRLRAQKIDNRIRFDIIDQGIGIPPKDQPHIFEPFRRADNALDLPGNGLGLVVVKQNVEAHGGTISFESNPGKGTTFTVEIPL